MARDLIFLKSNMFLIHGSDIVFHQDYQIDRELSKTQPKNLAGITLVALLFGVVGVDSLTNQAERIPCYASFLHELWGRRNARRHLLWRMRRKTVESYVLSSVSLICSGDSRFCMPMMTPIRVFGSILMETPNTRVESSCVKYRASTSRTL